MDPGSPRPKASPKASSSSPSTLPVLKEGFLDKLGWYMRMWKRRWFRLLGHTLYYYQNASDDSPKGTIELIDCIIIPVSSVDLNTDDDSGASFCFEICASFSTETQTRKSYMLRCSSGSDMIDWIMTIREAVIVKASTILKHSMSPPELMGGVLVTVRSGRFFPSDCGFNLSLSLENEFSRQQKITNYRSNGPAPDWNEHFTFVIWCLNSVLNIRLAVRKRALRTLYLSASTQVSLGHSIPIKSLAEGSRQLDGWFELKKQLVEGDEECKPATVSRLDMRKSSYYDLEPSTTRVNMSIEFHEIEAIVQRLLENYQALKTLIMSNKYALALLLSHSIICKNDEIIYAVTRIYLYERKSLSLISWFLHIELERASDTSTLFRGDSILTKLISTYCRYLGSLYRRKLLSEILLRVCKDDTSYEIDESRLTDLTLVERNVQMLTSICTDILESILSKQKEMPDGIQIVLRTVHVAVTTRFPGYSTYKALSSFFFLRFLCPSIVGPNLLFEDSPVDIPVDFKKIPTNTRRTLILVGKILQSLVNEAGIGQKESFMLHFDRFIDHYRSELRKFYDAIVFPKDLPTPEHTPTPNKRGAIRKSQDWMDSWNYEAIRSTMSHYSDLKGLFDFHHHMKKSDIYKDALLVTNRTVAYDLVTIHRFLLDCPFPRVTGSRLSVYEAFGTEESEKMKIQGEQNWAQVLIKLRESLMEEAAQLSRINFRFDTKGEHPVVDHPAPGSSSRMHIPSPDLAQLQLLVFSIRLISPSDPLSTSPRFSLSDYRTV